MIDVPQKYAHVQTYGVKLTSHIHRSADRAIRSKADASGIRPHRPRRDDEIMGAWVIRGAKRAGAMPVDAPSWSYDPGFSGPAATQVAVVRCLIPKTEGERVLFDGLRLAPDTYTLNYFDPDFIVPPAVLVE